MITFHHIYKYSQVHNTKTICLFELFQTHSFQKPYYIAQSQVQESSKYGIKIYPFLGGVHETAGQKHPHITILQNWL